MRYQFTADHDREYRIRAMCRVLQCVDQWLLRLAAPTRDEGKSLRVSRRYAPAMLACRHPSGGFLRFYKMQAGPPYITRPRGPPPHSPCGEQYTGPMCVEPVGEAGRPKPVPRLRGPQL